ncbi:MAG: 1-acyl-sn-glycerol-3-phosphate acyltransferase [Candidatus Marinimicrobia bacterium]|nr:1-acyl-sn-glycerol-3-phosphate acyltransferase [Candidatus Neomarinimicrobiota bacterium]
MKRILSAYLWTVGILIFVPLTFFAILCSIFSRPETYDKWVKAGFRFLLRSMLIKITVEGLENIDKRQSYIFMPNHVSLFDMPVLAGYIPNVVRAVEAEENFKIPVYGKLIKWVGNIPISRENIHASIKTFKAAIDNLAPGRSLAIFPEGHRTMTGYLGEFKKLPFFIIREAGIPIVPIGMSGLYQLKSKHSWIIQPVTVKVKFGEAIDPGFMENLSPLDLRSFVKGKIENLVEYS